MADTTARENPATTTPKLDPRTHAAFCARVAKKHRRFGNVKLAVAYERKADALYRDGWVALSRLYANMAEAERSS